MTIKDSKNINKIKDKNLEFNKLYNSANAYVKLGELQKAVEFYEKALKIKKDKDAEYNLKLIKKLLKQKPKPKTPTNKTQKNKKKYKRERRFCANNGCFT